MKDIKEKIRYIYYNTDGLFHFLSNRSVNSHAKRCILRRFFILVDSYFEMIGYLKNDLANNKIINLNTKKSLMACIESIKSQWSDYQIIRDKYSAHHQDIDDSIIFEWWNEIDHSTITFYYEGMREIREILANADILSLTTMDYSEIDFSDTCLKEFEDDNFYLSHDRLALSKKNTSGTISCNPFQRKCMLLSSIIDFICINCALTTKTARYKTCYENILFDSAWLLICCDTFSLIENMYENGNYGLSLMAISPFGWKGAQIIEEGNSCRNKIFEENLKALRNGFAAHIDKKENFETLIYLFQDFDLKQLYEYCIYHKQIFQRACFSDIRTKQYVFSDVKLSDDIIALAYSEHKPIDK